MVLRSAVTVAMAAVFLAGCAGPTATGSLVPSTTAPTATAATPTSAPTTTPTGAPQQSVPPPSAGIVCPSDLPTDLASVEELADPSCYGDLELTIDGWLTDGDVSIYPGETEPAWTNPWLSLGARVPTVAEWVVEPVFLGHLFFGPSIAVVARRAIEPDAGALNRWVRVRGHFDDPTASSCRPVRPLDDPSDQRDCSSLFVLSDVEVLDHVADCPTASPLPVVTFLEADATCFIGREVTLSGWEVERGGIGGSGPVYQPTVPSSVRLADSILSADRRVDVHPDVFLYVWTVEGSGVRFDRRNQRVLVTGSFGQPITRECRAPAPTSWTWSPPLAWAQQRCGAMFVITNVRDLD